MTFAQIIAQHDRVVHGLIMRRVKQRDVIFTSKNADRVDLLLRLGRGKFGAIALLKFFLTLGLMAEPAPQRIARRDIFRPKIDVRIVFA